MARKSTDAQLRAVKKYHEKLDEIKFRLPKGGKEKYKESAEIAGVSLNRFMEIAANRLVIDYRITDQVLRILSEEMLDGMARAHVETGNDDAVALISDIFTDACIRVFYLFDEESGAEL